MSLGLPEHVGPRLKEIFARHGGIEKVVVYGSRALGTMREGSDIDLAFEGSMSFAEFQRVLTDMDELNLPWMIDASFLQDMGNPDLLDHIAKHGQVLYDREDYTP